MTITRYPIDFDALKKGDVLETDALIAALDGKRPSDGDSWRFAVMGLREQIMRETTFVVKMERERLRILEDAEADEYLYEMHERGVRAVVRAAERRCRIDRDNLSPTARDIAERRDRVVTAVALAAHSELRKRRRIEGLATRLLPRGPADREE